MLIEAQSDGTDDIKRRREIARFQKLAEQDAMKKHWEVNERHMIINEKAFNNRLLGALAHQEKCENAYKGSTLEYQKKLVEQKKQIEAKQKQEQDLYLDRIEEAKAEERRLLIAKTRAELDM